MKSFLLLAFISFLFVFPLYAEGDQPPEISINPIDEIHPLAEQKSEDLKKSPKGVEQQKQPAANSHLKKLLVLPVIDKGAGLQITQAISDAISKQAVESFKGVTLTPKDIEADVQRTEFQMALGCESEDCMASIGEKVEAELVLAGNVAKVGDDFLITLLLTEVATSKRIAYEQRKAPAHNDLFFYTAKQLTSIVLTGKAASFKVPVNLQIAGGISPDIIVDGKIVPMKNGLIELDPGVHEIKLKAPGYTTWKSSLQIEAGTPISLQAELLESRSSLWPVTATFTTLSLVSITAFMTLTTMAQLRYGLIQENMPFLNALYDQKESYRHKNPVSSSELSALKQEISLLAISGDVALALGIVFGVAAFSVLTADLVAAAGEE